MTTPDRERVSAAALDGPGFQAPLEAPERPEYVPALRLDVNNAGHNDKRTDASPEAPHGEVESADSHGS